MAMRSHEIHPMPVHFPLGLLPLAIAADGVGAMTDNQALMDMGKTLIPLVVASMAATGVAGFAAQEEVRAAGETHDMLVTPATSTWAPAHVRRSRGHAGGAMRPRPGYHLACLAGAALMTYSGYLGGKMVYRHGVGVGPAGGYDPERSPRDLPQGPSRHDNTDLSLN